jgi:hypothetical protein
MAEECGGGSAAMFGEARGVRCGQKGEKFYLLFFAWLPAIQPHVRSPAILGACSEANLVGGGGTEFQRWVAEEEGRGEKTRNFYPFARKGW